MFNAQGQAKFIVIFNKGALEKMYVFVTYSNVLSINYKIKSNMYLLILFKLTCLYN